VKGLVPSVKSKAKDYDAADDIIAVYCYHYYYYYYTNYYVSLLLQEPQVSGEIAQPTSSGSSGMTRPRRQTPPRRVLPSTSQVSEAPTTASNQPEGDEGGEKQERPSVAPPNPRELLLALPQIVATHIPNEQSLEKLKSSRLKANRDPAHVS